LIVVFDGDEDAGDVIDRDAGCDPSSGNSYAIADEQVSVATGDVVEVDFSIQGSTDCPHVS
jgi:hypothetical protein